MINRLRYILLTLLLIAASQAAGQYIIDKVCVGSERWYRTDGEPGSTYIWKLTDPSNNVTTLGSDADTVAITWNMAPGIYKLSTIQHSVVTNCDGVIEIGDIEVFDQPTAFAGNPKTYCTPDPYQLLEATATNYSHLQWTTSGDGSFDNDTILHPFYSPGPGDLAFGSVTLTLTATGLGNGTTCAPAVSSVVIHQSATIVAVIATATPVSCFGGNDGTATAIPTGGTGTYTYLWDDPAAQTTITATGLFAGTYTVIVTDANGCADTASVTVTQPPSALSIIIVSQTNVTCFGLSDGSVTVTGSGGTPPYSYVWNTIPVQTTATISNLVAGIYIVIVTDDNNCKDTLSVTITEPPLVMASAGPDVTACQTIPFLISGSSASNFSSIIWTHNGTGTLINPTSINPTYIPGGSELGVVTLTMKVFSILPCSDSIVDQMTLTIFALPTGILSSVGNTQFCEGDSTTLRFDLTGSPMWILTYSDGTTNTTVNVASSPLIITVFPTGSSLYTIVSLSDIHCTATPAQLTGSVQVNVWPKPTVDFTWNAGSQNNEIEFHIDSSSTNWNVIGNNVLWNFGDGNYGYGWNPVHIYAAGGTYDVMLTVTDTNGCSNFVIHQITIATNPVTAFFSSNSPVCDGQPVCFTDLSTASIPFAYITTWIWDFGDASPQDTILFPASPDICHLYANAGTWAVTLKVIDNNGLTDSHTANVTVLPNPVADFFYSATLCPGQVVSFTDASDLNGGGSIQSWNWNFDDPGSGLANTSNLVNPTHIFTYGDSTYFVRLIIVNFNNCTDTVIKPVYIHPRPPVDFTYDSACLNQPVHFAADPMVTQIDSIAAWLWNFGDGTPPVSDPVSTSHIYPAVGVYTVTLTVTDVHGCTNFVTHTIRVNPLPLAAFTWDAPVCQGAAVQYHDHSSVSAIFSGYIAKWLWDFGDGTTQTVVLPASPDVSHVFVGNSLTHTVRLTVWTNDSCSAYIEHTVTSIPGPTADFDYSTVNCPDLAVQFTDQSQTNGGGNITWLWNFGDSGSGTSNISILQNPVHTYAAAGTYAVNLTVTNVNGCFDTITKSITINGKPVADFSADTACLGSPTTFTDLSDPIPPAVIISWSWNFGDGTPPNTQVNPVHTYSNSGLFTVTLTVTNSNGCVNSVAKQVLVNPLPTAAFSFTTQNCIGSPVCFTDLSTTPPGYLGQIVRWVWDFGDGTTQTVLSPANPDVCHTFVGGALANVVRLTVTTSDSCSHFVEHTVNSVPSPIAGFGYSTVNCAGQAVQFNDQSLLNGGGPVISWSWNFGDPVSGAQNTSTIQNPQHTFATSNTYSVTLVITNNAGCTDTIVKDIFINQLPVADFIADTACAGSPTTFTDLSTSNVTLISWSWNFGDGSVASTLQNPVHTYTASGVYMVTLTITNSNGCIHSVTEQVLVNPLPIAAFSFPAASCQGAPVCFVNASTTPPGYLGQIVKWVWDFGDGTPPQPAIWFPANPDICHVFPATSTSYVVRLTVTTSDSCTHFVEHTVNTIPSPVADFNWSPATCVNTLVSFFDQSLLNGGGPIISWNWNFGDPGSGGNNFSTLQNPTHSFTASGNFNVTLIINNISNCPDTIEKTITVNQLPTADFNADTACAGSGTSFTDLSLGNGGSIVSWAWNFGDGSVINTLPNPTYTYASYGLFNVTLTVTNSNGCIHSITKPVLVLPLPVAAFIYDTPTCMGAPVNYTDMSSTVPGFAGSIVKWVWDFGDGTVPVTIWFPNSPDITHVFAGNANSHIVRLTVTTATPDSCTHFVEHTVNSIPSPQADFSYPPTSCINQPVLFTDQTQINGGGPIVTWNWNFGDPGSGAQNTNNTQNPVHLFSGTGPFDVTLIVFNSTGCSDTILKTITVSAKPFASFTADTACKGSVTTFTDQSTVPAGSGLISAHFWEFGDGGTSTQTNPTHLYVAAGTYPVKLTVTTTHGCTKDTTIQVVVNPLPTASFIFNSPTCAGDSVQFTDLSTSLGASIVRWKWAFGDGQTTIIDFPASPDVKHAYANGGNYNVTLTVTTSDSCSDFKTLPITIYAKPVANFLYSTTNCQLMPVQFTDISQGTGGIPVVSWSWNFDDPGSGTGNTSTLQNPSHTFSTAGTFNVLLAVTNANGCIDSIIKPVTISVAPVAQFTFDTACIDNPTHFTDGSFPGSGTLVAWQWNFGDPASGIYNTSAQQNPSHIYAVGGTYNVTLVVTNSNLCEKDTVIPVNVNPAPVALFSYAASCVGDSTQFTDLSTAPNSQITDWLWEFGDGGTSTLQNPKHAYMASGTYDVKLKVTNLSGCMDSIVLQVIAHAKPVAAFSYNTFFCPAGQVMFQDQSQGSGASITERYWIFEAGSTSTLINPVHIFSVTDTIYVVTLIVTDTFGCKDTIADSIYVKPGYSFTFTYDTVCFGSPTHFTPQNLVQGDSLFFVTWNFGDPASGSNNISNDYSPQHIFSQPGTFIVKMKARNRDNCVDSVYKTITVRGLPQVLFTSVSEPCNNVVHFTDQSLPGNGAITQWEWTFGDGTPPVVIPAPGPGDVSHTYANSGDYMVTLKVTNSNGCSGVFTDSVQTVPCISASFTHESLLCARCPVIFSDHSLPVSSISSWHWFWGDGSDTLYSVYAATVTHEYLVAGNYIVKLVIKTMVGTVEYSDSATQLITVSQTPEALFSNTAVCLNKTTLFRDTSETFGEQTISRIWNFGDPSSGTLNTSSMPNPSHKYDTAGVYQVKLLVVNKFGCKDSLIKPTLVFALPDAHFSNSIACQGNPTNFTDNSVIADTSIMAWQWNFGVSGTKKDTSGVQDPVYQYKTEGDYLVRLIVMDHNGCADTVDSTIRVNVTPVSGFTMTENFNGMPGRIRLNNVSAGATGYEWEFGNGSSSTEENPVTTYTMDGTYLIMLVSSNEFNCTDTSYYNYEMLFKGLWIPNAFAPTSGNQAIRLFKPVGRNLKEYNIRVYNNFGRLIWESSRLDSEGRPVEGWDGTYEGTLMPVGTYMWKASAIFIDDTIWQGSDIGMGEYKTMGTVSLVR